MDTDDVAEFVELADRVGVAEDAARPLFVTSPAYAVDIGSHVFPTSKYARIAERLITETATTRADFVAPDRADPSTVLRVHDRVYYEHCRDDRLSAHDIARLELPWSAALFDASMRCVQGSVLAAKLALQHGAGLHIGGGFHHAYPDHGEGFCVFNDHACAIRALQADGLIERAAVVDCDLHQGNGTAAIFQRDSTVETFSIHEQSIYPFDRPPSTLDIGLAAGTGDAEYLDLLGNSVPGFLQNARPQLVVYVAGADPFEQDQLGSLRLTHEGLRRRDELVIGACAELDLPLVVVLAGGYARRVEDTVAIHVETLRIASKLWRCR